MNFFRSKVIETKYFLFVFFDYKIMVKKKKKFYESILNEIYPRLTDDRKELKLKYDYLGSPYLDDSRFRISISHSYKYGIIVITNRKYRLGIDIQHIDKKINVNSFITEDEEHLIRKNRIDPIGLVSIKESLGKSFNMGLLAKKELYTIKSIKSLEGYNNFTVCIVSFCTFQFLIGFSINLQNEYFISLTINNEELLIRDITDMFCKELAYEL
ncbi:hypothetical protein J6TS1_43030 [Siminovitchia terrae]|uniref:4'-phosphopantetheinyl transferase domain-containing protein n=1 Tax=Siminovitchia terrae TaxID=1914933 RepID=A0ABQ4L2C6_SIMTE|nr:hypothetical protein [Siminovitchia terrae]GIN98433.1 hypothetical protein J6TS1_43030 [Siminovitchia terrae]